MLEDAGSNPVTSTLLLVGAFGAVGKAHLILSQETTGSSPVTPTLGDGLPSSKGHWSCWQSSPDFHSGDHRFESDMPYVAAVIVRAGKYGQRTATGSGALEQGHPRCRDTINSPGAPAVEVEGKP